jgi:hypothetical protein
MSGRRLAAPTRPTLVKITQKFFRRNEERILLKDPADDDHRVGAQHVNHGVASKLTEMVGTDNRVFMATPHLIYSRLERNNIVHVRSIFNGPIHTTANAT